MKASYFEMRVFLFFKKNFELGSLLEIVLRDEVKCHINGLEHMKSVCRRRQIHPWDGLASSGKQDKLYGEVIEMGSMKQENGGNLIISGSGSAGGGVYQLVKISGSGEVTGDVECDQMKISGSSKLNGNIKTRTTKVSGSSTIDGNLEGESIEISGSSEIQGHLASTSVSVSGSVKVAKSLSGKDIEIKGSTKVAENCAAEKFEAKGSFEIGGLLNADTVDIALFGESKVREISGESIQVRKRDKGFPLSKLVHSFFPQRLTVDTIEGDDIDLECTNAKVVRGNNVNIGADCDIDLVEYKNDFQQDREAKVGGSKKI